MEKTQDVIKLPGISASSLETIINYIYGADLDVTVHNVYDLLDAGYYLDVQGEWNLVCVFGGDAHAPSKKSDCKKSAYFVASTATRFCTFLDCH